jgi:lysozyme
MKVDTKGILLISEFEGLRLKPYFATPEEQKKGIATIGYGNTFYPNGKKVEITDKEISKKEAIDMLTLVVDSFAKKLVPLIKKEINQNQFNALVSLAYNIGVSAFSKSTVLRLVNNNPSDGNIAKAFLMWNKQAGKELPGLTKRRIKESSIYFTKT